MELRSLSYKKVADRYDKYKPLKQTLQGLVSLLL